MLKIVCNLSLWHFLVSYLSQFYICNYINRFKDIIEEGIDSGEFKENIDKKLAVMTLFSSLNWMPLWYDTHNNIVPADLGQQLADMLVNGLKK